MKSCLSNNAISTSNNAYLDGIGCNNPELATNIWNASDNDHNAKDGRMDGNCIYLWITTIFENERVEAFPFRFCSEIIVKNAFSFPFRSVTNFFFLENSFCSAKFSSLSDNHP